MRRAHGDMMNDSAAFTKSVADKRMHKNATPQHASNKRDGASSHGRGHSMGHSSRSYDSSDQKSTKKQMIRFLSRILDKNKPLFVFNTRLGADDSEDGCGTPSFSMITLIHEND